MIGLEMGKAYSMHFGWVTSKVDTS